VLALQKIYTCSLTHDVSSLEDDNVFVFCVGLYAVFVTLYSQETFMSEVYQQICFSYCLFRDMREPHDQLPKLLNLIYSHIEMGSNLI
jgi:hypothetical protein